MTFLTGDSKVKSGLPGQASRPRVSHDKAPVPAERGLLSIMDQALSFWNRLPMSATGRIAMATT